MLESPSTDRPFLPETSWWRMGWRLLGSMRLAIVLLAAIALASVIGTVVPQHQPHSLYADLYGTFWARTIDALGFSHVYQTAWYVLMLAFLVLSTSACLLRHIPVIVRDWNHCREDISLQALHALGNSVHALLPQPAAAAAQRMGQQLADAGWQVRLQERSRPKAGWMVAARTGRLNRIGFLAGHGAVALICLGGLLDSNWLLRAHMAWLGKTPYRGSSPVEQVLAQHRLGPDTPGFRGRLTVTEGSRNAAALVAVNGGTIIQDLPFAVELLRFHAEHYASGAPRLYASDVILHDRATGKAVPGRIAVNHPLQYRGITLYQSGFDDGGSLVTLQAVPLAPGSHAFTRTGKVGASVALPPDPLPRSLEITGLHPQNIETPYGTTPDSIQATAQIEPLLQGQLHTERAAQTQPQPRDVGPSIAYRLRDASGQPMEFHNYMRPVQTRAGAAPEYLFGVRTNPADNWRYLRIPADASGGLDDFLRLHAALHNPQRRARAIQRYVQQAVPSGNALLAQQLTQSAQRVLEHFAGNPVLLAQARRHPQDPAAHRFGLAGVAALIEARVPAQEQEQVANALLHMLNGTLLQLLQAERTQAGLPMLDMTQPRNQAFMQQVVLALGDAAHYPEAQVFTLQDFQPVHASVFQVTRSPGKWLVYAGSALLILGILLMLYVRERRIWIWLTPDPAQSGHTQALLAFFSPRCDAASHHACARMAAALLQGGHDDIPG